MAFNIDPQLEAITVLGSHVGSSEAFPFHAAKPEAMQFKTAQGDRLYFAGLRSDRLAGGFQGPCAVFCPGEDTSAKELSDLPRARFCVLLHGNRITLLKKGSVNGPEVTLTRTRHFEEIGVNIITATEELLQKCREAHA